MLFRSTPMSHAGITTGCASCHSGTYAGVVAKPASHFPTTAACENCHRSTTAFSTWTMSHAGITAACATCHGGAYTSVGVVAKPANHFPTAVACDVCHKSTTTFSGTRMIHSGVVTAGSCNTCHERGMSWVGGIVTRPSGHSGSRGAPNSCDNSGCHNTTTFSK